MTKKRQAELIPILIQPTDGDKVVISYLPRADQKQPDDEQLLTASILQAPEGHILLDSFEWLDSDTGIKVEDGEPYVCKCIQQGLTCEDCPLKRTFMECTRGASSHFVRASSSYVKCKNQRLGSGYRAPIQLKWFKGMGIGVVAAIDFKKGDTAGQYTGNRRLKSSRKTNYQAEINDKVVVDCKLRSTFMRYVNYACNANSEMEVWNVEGELMVSINASVAFPAGSQITMLCMDSEYVGQCNCSAVNCKGHLKLQAQGSLHHTGDSDLSSKTSPARLDPCRRLGGEDGSYREPAAGEFVVSPPRSPAGVHTERDRSMSSGPETTRTNERLALADSNARAQRSPSGKKAAERNRDEAGDGARVEVAKEGKPLLTQVSVGIKQPRLIQTQIAIRPLAEEASLPSAPRSEEGGAPTNEGPITRAYSRSPSSVNRSPSAIITDRRGRRVWKSESDGISGSPGSKGQGERGERDGGEQGEKGASTRQAASVAAERAKVLSRVLARPAAEQLAPLHQQSNSPSRQTGPQVRGVDDPHHPPGCDCGCGTQDSNGDIFFSEEYIRRAQAGTLHSEEQCRADRIAFQARDIVQKMNSGRATPEAGAMGHVGYLATGNHVGEGEGISRDDNERQVEETSQDFGVPREACLGDALEQRGDSKSTSPDISSDDSSIKAARKLPAVKGGIKKPSARRLRREAQLAAQARPSESNQEIGEKTNTAAKSPRKRLASELEGKLTKVQRRELEIEEARFSREGGKGGVGGGAVRYSTGDRDDTTQSTSIPLEAQLLTERREGIERAFGESTGSTTGNDEKGRGEYGPCGTPVIPRASQALPERGICIWKGCTRTVARVIGKKSEFCTTEHALLWLRADAADAPTRCKLKGCFRVVAESPPGKTEEFCTLEHARQWVRQQAAVSQAAGAATKEGMIGGTTSDSEGQVTRDLKSEAGGNGGSREKKGNGAHKNGRKDGGGRGLHRLLPCQKRGSLQPSPTVGQTKRAGDSSEGTSDAQGSGVRQQNRTKVTSKRPALESGARPTKVQRRELEAEEVKRVWEAEKGGGSSDAEQSAVMMEQLGEGPAEISASQVSDDITANVQRIFGGVNRHEKKEPEGEATPQSASNVSHLVPGGPGILLPMAPRVERMRGNEYPWSYSDSGCLVALRSHLLAFINEYSRNYVHTMEEGLMVAVESTRNLPTGTIAALKEIAFTSKDPVVIFSRPQAEVDVSILLSLEEGECLKGEVLNALAAAIQDRFDFVAFACNKGGCDIFIATTYFFSKLWDKRNSSRGRFAAISKWFKGVQFSEVSKLIIPVHILNIHWICMVLDKSLGSITWFDSMGGSYMEHAMLLQDWWNHVVQGPAYTFVKGPGIVPTQLPESNDCGIFTAAVMYDQAADTRCRSLPEPDQTGLMRRWLMFILVRGGLGNEARHLSRARELNERSGNEGPAGAPLTGSL